MTDAAKQSSGLSVASVALDEGMISRIMPVAAETGTTRSQATGELAALGAARMLRKAAGGNAALHDTRAAMPDGTTPKLTPGLVETKALPQIARDLGADPRWLAALPQAQRREMSARIARAASSLAAADGTLSWSLVLSTARVLCRWSSPSWMLSAATRTDACPRVEKRITWLLTQARSGKFDDANAIAKDEPAAADVGADAATELASLSAWRLAAEVSDVPGAPPEGPLALVAELLAPRARGLVDDQTVEIRQEAGERLSALLGIDDEEGRAVGATARSALQALQLANDASVRTAALALASYAQRLSKPIGSNDTDSQDKAALALSQRGAREIVGYAAAHPRAKLAALGKR